MLPKMDGLQVCQQIREFSQVPIVMLSAKGEDMDKIMGLPGDTDVLPGHGGKSTIAWERTNNPFLQPFNEPGEDEDFEDGEGIELNGNI